MKPTIICADSHLADLELLRSLLCTLFGATHDILAYGRGDHALDAYERLLDDGTDVPVVISEMHLEDMSGDDLLERIDMRSKHTNKIMVMGDCSAESIARTLSKVPLFRLVVKPWDPDELAMAMYQAIESYDNHENVRALVKQNETLLRHLKTTLRETIDALSTAVEARDAFTNGHTWRVTELALRLADSMRLSSEDAEQLEMACLLHDVGKIGVPDSVLLATHAYSPDEYRQMKEHVITGANIISKISGLDGLGEIVRHHHEHYDGSGYPDGLAGERIPLIARIICLADAYDAMISDRNFRSRYSRERIIAEISMNSGKHFDPVVVEHFLKLSNTL